jgi:hypothetical protein
MRKRGATLPQAVELAFERLKQQGGFHDNTPMKMRTVMLK